MTASLPQRPVMAGEHILTVQEALEPLYMELEQQVETKLVQVAVSAGWSAAEAIEAIDELKRHEVLEIGDPER
ncbi:hypothetical protein NGR_b23360 (plasmid) [Sinorhizobium fredii NGR234]|uniref:Uncharacterized protein n=1 Tax=Sinorhizobium fredii (strain NBRC 101917 / NGR234) TaxID=394 RepID=C3KNF0_SINFN|nr:hypothetical protein [Sinorhizobium fredii]ACP23780.1 hypothetical protein NGR_b23360 [Sinorhizobium fredii NGR234]